MKNKFYILIFLIFSVFNFPCFASEKIKVVATISSFADIAAKVGGDLVETRYVASPIFNPHFIEPKPSDVLRLKRADLFIHAGMDLEAWRGPLVNAAGQSELRSGGSKQLDLSAGIPLLEVPDGFKSRAEGDIHLYGNPHYWLDPRNAKIIAASIATKLAEMDPSNKETYFLNKKTFCDELDLKIAEWQQLLKPYAGQELIGYHNEWVYLINFSGLKMDKFLEPKPGIPPTPKHVEYLKNYLLTNKIKGIVQATFYPKDVSEVLASECGAKLLLLCQNVGEVSEASDYIKMIEYNIGKLLEGLKHE